MKYLARIFGKKLEYLDQDVFITEYHFLGDVYIWSWSNITQKQE